MIGIRCERGSHRFFKKYGEKFEDSEGKQIFLEFADEERAHLDLLVREYRALVKRQGRARRSRDPGPRFHCRARRALTLRPVHRLLDPVRARLKVVPDPSTHLRVAPSRGRGRA